MSDARESRGEPAATTVFVCFPMTDECICCGGSATGPGTPFEAPEGSQAMGLYCSEECWSEWEEQCIREAERWKRWYGCCPECGFDRQEHDHGCSRAAAS